MRRVPVAAATDCLMKTGFARNAGKLRRNAFAIVGAGVPPRVIQSDAGSILICEKCGSSCALCSCSDKRYAQRRESLELDGKIVMNDLPKSGIIAQIACIVAVLGSFLLFCGFSPPVKRAVRWNVKK